MEIVKVRLQTQAKGGVPKTMFDVVRELGVLGLYRGAGITMARDVPSSAIFFACYTLLQQLYPNQNFMAECLAAIPTTVLVHRWTLSRLACRYELILVPLFPSQYFVLYSLFVQIINMNVYISCAIDCTVV